VSSADASTVSLNKAPNRAVIISALGVTQIFAWGTSYYLPAVLAAPIVADTGWSLSRVVGGLSLGLLTAGVASPFVGRTIARRGGRPVLAVSAGLLATGLLALALAHSLPVFVLAWLVMGLGMARGFTIPLLRRWAVSMAKADVRRSQR
jgi:MFS family permease